MRVSRLMGLAVILVALVVTMNAFAYKTAEVTNALSLTVSSTTGARLALNAADSIDPGVTADVAANELAITINDEVQPNSVYTFRDVFKMTNNAGYTVTVTCTITNADVTVSVRNAADDSDICASSSLAASATVQAYLEVTIPTATAIGAKPGTIVITGTR